MLPGHGSTFSCFHVDGRGFGDRVEVACVLLAVAPSQMCSVPVVVFLSPEFMRSKRPCKPMFTGPWSGHGGHREWAWAVWGWGALRMHGVWVVVVLVPEQ